MLEDMNTANTQWSLFQQPAHSSNSAVASFRSLLAAIDLGWKVEEPVKVLLSPRTDSWTYFFVLSNRQFAQRCSLYLPAVLNVIQFVEQNSYQVVEGSYYVDWKVN